MIIGMGLSLYEGDIEIGQEYKVGTLTRAGTTYERFFKIVEMNPPGTASGNMYYSQGSLGASFVRILSMQGMLFSGSTVIFPSYNVHYPKQYSTDIQINNEGVITARTGKDMSSYGKLLVPERNPNS